MILSAKEIDDGFITARIWATKVLYVSRGLVSPPPFEPPERIAVDKLWVWSGQPGGGLPDGIVLEPAKKSRAKSPGSVRKRIKNSGSLPGKRAG